MDQCRSFAYVPIRKRLLHVARILPPFDYIIVSLIVISLPQGPTKSVTASTLIPSSSTFYVGSYDGRIISGSIDNGIENLNGDGHTNLVSGLTGADGGRAWSVGYDDKIREITANGFTWVHPPFCGCTVHFRF